jgi:hypothetical protein
MQHGSSAQTFHPVAGWRSRSSNDRTLLVISYFALSYVIVFGLLHAIAA